jgi:hypothetical protein
MTAYNVVRFRVKPGQEAHFIAAHRDARANFKGFRGGALIKTGDNTFYIVGEWTNFKALAAARPQMIDLLNSFRDDLEDLGNGLGVTDPISGEVVLKLAIPKSAKKKAKSRKAKRKKRN